MYAIIRTGGKQAKVRVGDVIDVERLRAEDEVTFTPLLIVDDDGNVTSGRAELADVKVVAKVLGPSAGPKVDIFKYKAKTGYRKRQGHRQKYTRIEVVEISAAGAAEIPPEEEKKPKPKAEKPKSKPEASETKAEDKAEKPKADEKPKAEEKPKPKAEDKPKAAEKPKAEDKPEAKPAADKSAAETEKPEADEKPKAKAAEAKAEAEPAADESAADTAGGTEEE